MDVHLARLAAEQADVVAAWQLMARGWTRKGIRHHARTAGWHLVHPGVYALTQAALTQVQRWMAAALTAPDTYLSDRSAANCWGVHIGAAALETVTRVGSGGPRRLGGVLVKRSNRLAGDTTVRNGVPITTPARTLIDIAPALPRRAVGRAFREAMRLKLLTTGDLAAALGRHRGRRGTRVLWHLSDRYSSLPYSRTRSNAEARALEVLHDAGVEPPKVNVHAAGEEADLVWRGPRVIIEIDGPQFHQFRDEDMRKQGLWEAAGYKVRRISSGDVYADGDALIALAPR